MRTTSAERRLATFSGTTLICDGFLETGPTRPASSIPFQPQPRGGSGVIIDSSGVILTNNHVVDDAGQVTVRLHDGREFQAYDVKHDLKADLAVVRIHAKNLPAAKLGDSSKMQVGDWVLALGEPFGLEGTVTAGIIMLSSVTSIDWEAAPCSRLMPRSTRAIAAARW